MLHKMEDSIRNVLISKISNQMSVPKNVAEGFLDETVHRIRAIAERSPQDLLQGVTFARAIEEWREGTGLELHDFRQFVPYIKDGLHD